jgi:hypothetical protein
VENDFSFSRLRDDVPGVPVHVLTTRSSAEPPDDATEHQGIVGADPPCSEDLRAVAEQGGVVEAADRHSVAGVQDGYRRLACMRGVADAAGSQEPGLPNQ